MGLRMLIAFSTENFRSIKEEVCLSLVANSSKEHEETNVLRPTLPPKVKPMRVLCSAALYGQNAGGKSNLIKALQVMRKIILRSRDHRSALPVTPFKFSEATLDAPSMFEVVILLDGVRYQYGFSATRQQIHEEWLFAFPKGRAQTWFKRELRPGTDKYEYIFGANLTGNKQTWKESTRSDALFLSTAIQLNSEQLLPVYQWFSDKLHICEEGWGPKFSIECCQSDRKDKVLNFLQAADFAISDIHVNEKKVPSDVMQEIKALFSSKIEVHEESEIKQIELKVKHQSNSGKMVEIDFNDESGGTQKIFCLAGPWIDVLAKGHTLFIDELQKNLHPNLVKFLVSLFHSKTKNQSGAQLIFSTHETNILDQDIFRRDQIWFCERSEVQDTRLFPLTDFSPRKKTENLEQAYLSGRYGALPYIRNITQNFALS
jgi:AAA15 family ATPase/GTPase